jgi:small multidrug resistance pump
MPYAVLMLAIAVEVLATSLLKLSNGLQRLWPSIGCLAGYGLAIVLLARVVRHVPVGVTYAIWSGLGTVSIVAIGVFALHEPLPMWKLVGVALVVTGVVLLNLRGAH